VAEFEEQMANFCNTKYAVSCCNGTAALHLALLACNIGPGDEVIIPTLTFIATANAVSYTGAKPVFVDVDSETWNIDPLQIEHAITSNTKAIIPVHLYGHPADMDPIIDLAKKYNLYVIEDAAEAHGAKYKGNNVGTFGDAGTFSFYGNKIVTTGEGGMVVTNDDKVDEKIRLLRDHGMLKSRRYWHSELGYNYRMTNLQAAIGVAQMDKIRSIISKKKKIAHSYSENLKGIKGVILPPEMPWANNVFWLYTILVDEEVSGVSVKEIEHDCKEQGIDTRPFFPPLHTQPIYKTGQKLPVSEKISSRGISLPSAPVLRTTEIERVCYVIRRLAQKTILS